MTSSSLIREPLNMMIGRGCDKSFSNKTAVSSNLVKQKTALSSDVHSSSSSVETNMTVECSKDFSVHVDSYDEEACPACGNNDAEESIVPVTCSILELNQDVPAKKSPAVRFHMIEIVEFPIEVGVDKVPATGGPPLGMGFIEERKITLKVDDYEDARICEPRNKYEMAVPNSERSTVLLANGATMREIVNSKTECDRIRKERTYSAQHVRWDKVNLILESVQRKAKRRLSSWSSKSSADARHEEEEVATWARI